MANDGMSHWYNIFNLLYRKKGNISLNTDRTLNIVNNLFITSRYSPGVYLSKVEGVEPAYRRQARINMCSVQ